MIQLGVAVKRRGAGLRPHEGPIPHVDARRRARVENHHEVQILNPGRNPNQVSRLRLINAPNHPAQVTVTGIDDEGCSPGGEVLTSIAAGGVRSFTAAELESDAEGLEGTLGTGTGRWRLAVESDGPITVVILLESPTGHLKNLSTSPGTKAAEAD